MDELKPCPFCDGDAEIERPGTSRQSMIVVCTSCGCKVESGDVFSPAQWNRRANDDAASAASVPLVDELLTMAAVHERNSRLAIARDERFIAQGILAAIAVIRPHEARWQAERQVHARLVEGLREYYARYGGELIRMLLAAHTTPTTPPHNPFESPAIAQILDGEGEPGQMSDQTPTAGKMLSERLRAKAGASWDTKRIVTYEEAADMAEEYERRLLAVVAELRQRASGEEHNEYQFNYAADRIEAAMRGDGNDRQEP